jgi:selenocysteine lyase/cysteine desulfurase
MSALPLPPCDAVTLKQRLYDDFSVEVPVYSWNDRVFLRISVQGYNHRLDIDTLVEALRQLLPESSVDPVPAD